MDELEKLKEKNEELLKTIMFLEKEISTRDDAITNLNLLNLKYKSDIFKLLYYIRVNIRK